jgi:hypothetical protein
MFNLKIFQSEKLIIKDFLLLYFVSLLPGLNWGTGLLIPLYLLLAFGWKRGVLGLRFSSLALPLFLSQLTLITIYFLSTKGVVSNIPKPEFSLLAIVGILKFVFFGISTQ